MSAIAWVINRLANLFVLVIFADAILSFVLSPYHPVRVALGKILQPFLSPIRRVVRPVGMFDFSPWILIVLVELFSLLLTSLLTAR